MKKPALTFQRPDSQHQLTLLALACALSFRPLTLNRAKGSSVAPGLAFGTRDNTRPLAAAVHDLGGQQTGG